MPWHIVEGHSECQASEPFAVVKDDGGQVVGCHETREAAEDQLAALNANVDHRSHGGLVEIIERSDSIVLDDVRFKERIIDVLAVPWDQEAEVMWRGQLWRELFERGAFNGIEGHAGRYPVNREHVQGDTVGRVVKFDPYAERGLIASARISKTSRGDDTLELAADGILGASVGYFVKQPSDYVATRRNMLRRIKRAFVHHLAMTASPAFDSAMPVAVREGPSARGAAGEPLHPTPVLEDVIFDDVFRWANERTKRSG